MAADNARSVSIPYSISKEMFSEQRKRLGAKLPQGSCALIQGGSEVPVNYTDCNYVFRQDSYFYYLFGLERPDCLGAVFPDGTGVIFIPQLDAIYATWFGPLPTSESVVRETGVETVEFAEPAKIIALLKSKQVATVHVLNGINSDSKLKVKTATFEGLDDAFKVDSSAFLYEVLSNQRVIKTALEQALLIYVNKVSSDAHIYVMKNCRPGMSQHQLEANFLHHTYYFGGCRLVSYTCICATGQWGAVLHYPDNNRPVEDGTMALLDMGGEYHCYCSDITCCFPVNGKFTPTQRWVYQAVLDAQRAVEQKLKPGVSWVEMHKIALRVMSQALIERGLLKGTVDEIEKKDIMYVFQPHGMGHLLGLDTHDVGGYPEGGVERPANLSCCRLRTARVVESGMFLTVEPGLYFNQYLLGEAFANPAISEHFNEALLRQPEHWNFGGVRLEDDVFITDKGCLVVTCVPRNPEDVERVMAGEQEWQGAPTEYINS